MLVKIGIILEEDERKEIEFITPTNKDVKVIYSHNNSLVLKKGTCYKIKLDKTKESFFLIGEKDNIILNIENFFYLLIEISLNDIILVNSKKEERSENNFFILKNVPIGRGFHWQKNIDILLCGKIIVKVARENIVLINEVHKDIYLMGVVTSEMSKKAPTEFLKAQIISAFSWYLVNKNKKHKEFDVCNDDCCQRFHGIENIDISIYNLYNEVQNLVLYYKDEICDTRYSKCCGGITESALYVWKDLNKEYLESIIDSKNKDIVNKFFPLNKKNIKEWIINKPLCFCNYEDIKNNDNLDFLGKVDKKNISYFRWEKEISIKEIKENLIKYNFIKNIYSINDIEIRKRGKSGRIIEIEIKYIDINKKKDLVKIKGEYNIRKLLTKSFLYSSAFIIEKKILKKNELNYIFIKGAGWGHGVGMCQIGALKMALIGYNFKDILYHYFPFTTIINFDNFLNKKFC